MKHALSTAAAPVTLIRQSFQVQTTTTAIRKRRWHAFLRVGSQAFPSVGLNPRSDAVVCLGLLSATNRGGSAAQAVEEQVQER